VFLLHILFQQLLFDIFGLSLSWYVSRTIRVRWLGKIKNNSTWIISGHVSETLCRLGLLTTKLQYNWLSKLGCRFVHLAGRGHRGISVVSASSSGNTYNILGLWWGYIAFWLNFSFWSWAISQLSQHPVGYFLTSRHEKNSHIIRHKVSEWIM